MDLASLPVAPVATIIGFLLTVIGWVLFLILTGRLVTRSQLEDAQKNADRFEHAWQISQETQSGSHEVLSKLGVLTTTFAHYLDSLPRNSDRTPNAPDVPPVTPLLNSGGE